MSAYNIQLPGTVLASLYKRTVVQGEGKAVETAAGQAGRGSNPSPAAIEETPVKATVEAPTPAPVTAPVAKPITAAVDTVPTPAPAPTQPTAAGPAATYKFLGNNRQQVVIIVRFSGEAFLPENHLQMLTKMLGACKLNLGDVAIINDASQQVEINALKGQLQPKRVLLFGVSPEETGLPLNFPAFKSQDYAGSTYLYTPSLDVLNQETEEGKLLKRKLWESLKLIFGV